MAAKFRVASDEYGCSVSSQKVGEKIDEHSDISLIILFNILLKVITQ